MADIYNPWQQMQPSSLTDGLATKTYQSMAGEGGEENEESEGQEHEMEGPDHKDMVAAAMQTIQQQSQLINSLMAMIKGEQPQAPQDSMQAGQ